MQVIWQTIGLPGSGKSTWAKKIVQENPGKYKRINKDDLRAMLDVSKWSKSNERFVCEVRDLMIIKALREGYSVIIDDTNFDDKHNQRFKELAIQIQKETNKQIQVLTNASFLEVPLEVCIQNDLKRLNSVGKDVIVRMHNQYLAKTIEPLKQDENLPKIYLCDIDGTVAKMTSRGPFDWLKVGEDSPIEHVIDTVKLLSKTNEIIFMSGRDECCKEETKEWIRRHFGWEPILFMRPQGDQRKDSIIKKELFDKHIRDKYYVIGVFDDRNQVVDTWRKEIGLTCFQVNYGNF